MSQREPIPVCSECRNPVEKIIYRGDDPYLTHGTVQHEYKHQRGYANQCGRTTIMEEHIDWVDELEY